ncbi:MAG: hypothetical protein ACE5HB_03365, partial [Terriglobia bacterium]
RERLDEIALRIETKAPADGRQEVVDDLVSALKLKTNLRFQVELCAPGTFPRQEFKTERLIDQRNNEVEGVVRADS